MSRNATARKFLSVILSVVLIFQLLIPAIAQTAPVNSTAGYSDMVQKSSWSYNAMMAAVDAGLLKGYDGRINPSNEMTRAEMITIILRALGLDASKGKDLTPFKADISSYGDVHQGDWYYEGFSMAYKLKLINGIGDDKMSPDGKVTREQAFSVLCRLMNLDVTNAELSVLDRFEDPEDLSDWAKPYTAAMIQAGYVSGSNGYLMPKNVITRQEFAQLLYNLFGTGHIFDQRSADNISGKTINGNLIISAGAITLFGVTVNGDIIIGDGAGDASVTLDGVKISNRLIVRGGGVNTIYLKNTITGPVVIEKLSDGGIRILSDGMPVEYLEIADGNDTVIIECDVNELLIKGSGLDVVLKGQIQDLIVSGDDNKISGSGSAKKISLEGDINDITVSLNYETIVNNTQNSVLLSENGNKVVIASNTTLPKVIPQINDPDQKVYTVSFDTQGGTDISQISAISGTSLGTMPVPYKEDSIFIGWYIDKDTFTNEVAGDTPITSDLTLYAFYMPASPPEVILANTMTSVVGVSPDHSINIIAKQPMTAEAVKEAITVESSEGRNGFAGLYAAPAPDGSFTLTALHGYKPGASYTLTLTDPALNFDGFDDVIRKYNITVANPDPVLNLRLDPGIRSIPAGDISNITQNGQAVDSLFSPLFVIDEEKSTDTLIGTFDYSGTESLSTGDTLAVYEGTPPNERIAGVNYSNQSIAYVKVTGTDGILISYINADASDVLFTPDIFPVNIADDEDGDRDNLSLIIEISKLNADYFINELGLDLRMDSSTIVEAGDFLAFYEAPLDADALIGYARITHVYEGALYYRIYFEQVSLDEIISGMDIAASRQLSYDQLTQTLGEDELSTQLRQQVMDSGFVESASDFLVKLANTDEDTRQQVIRELGIKDFRMTQTGDIGLLADGSSQDVSVDFSFRISRILEHYEGEEGLLCEITVTCEISLGDNVSIVVTGTFTQEIKIELDISGSVTLAWALFIPIPIDFDVDASISIYTYTGLSLNALLTTSSGKKDLYIQQKIAELSNTDEGSLPVEEKSKILKEFYELYQEMLEQEHDYFELFKIPIAQFKGGVDPLNIIAFSISVDFVVSVDANVSLGIDFAYEKATRYSVHLQSGAKFATTKQTELVDGNYGFIVYVMGTLGLRAGVKVTVEVGLIDTSLDSIGFSVELGAYWRMWGFVYYQLTYENNVTTSSYGGGLYMELGIYLQVDFIAQILNNKYEYVVTLFEREWPLLQIGDRYYVFNFAYSLDPESDDIAINNTPVFTLPGTYLQMHQMDYKTGKISIRNSYLDEFTYKIEGDTLGAFRVTDLGVVTIMPPAGATNASAKLIISWKKDPLSFTSEKLSRTFVLNWTGAATGSYFYHFETNGGRHLNSISIGYGYKLRVYPVPYRTGYDFTGWFTNPEFNNYLDPDNDIMPDGDVTLYARWQPKYITYTVRLYQQQLDGSYRFWYSYLVNAWADQEITNTPFDYEGFITPPPQTVHVAPDGTTVVEHYYERELYSATFKTNYGADDSRAKEIVLTARYGSLLHPPSLVKPGHTFAGWSPALPQRLTNDNVTYEASWSRNEYTITYDYKYGVPETPNPATYNIETDTITLVNPKRGPGFSDGNVFTGWTGSGLNTPVMTVTIPKGSIGDLYFTANWTTLQRYDVRHIRENTQGSYSLVEFESLSGGAGELTQAVPRSYEGFSLREDVTQQLISTANDTLINIYYSRNSYDLTFDPNGGEGGGTQSVKYGSSIYAAYAGMPQPSREGYVLSGWSPVISSDATMPAHDVTYTAQWSQASYTITYDLAGGIITGTNPGGYNVDSLDITLINPVKHGYIFQGWIGTSLAEPSLLVTIPTGSTGNRQYTATWAEDPDYRTLTFDAMGGQGGYSTRVMPGDPITPPSVSRTMYIFAGWFVDDGSGSMIEFTQDVMPDHDLTVYAMWDAVYNMIIYDMNGVDVYSVPDDADCWTDYPAILPSRIYGSSGLALAGWSTTRDGSGGKSYGRGDLIYALTPFDGAEITLYAQWKPQDSFGVFDAMYMVTGQVFGLDENGIVTDDVYDASVSGEKPLIDYPFFDSPFMYFRVKKTGDAANPVALYLYKSYDMYGPVSDFYAYPIIPYDPDDPGNPYSAPEGSLIGSGENDGLTSQCKTSLQSKYGRGWEMGLVTVGKIIMLWEDSRYDSQSLSYNPGFIFESVNGVRYFIGGRMSYSYGMEYQYEYIDFGYTITNPDPDMDDIDQIDYYKPGPISSLG